MFSGHGQSPVGERDGDEAKHREINTSPDDGRDPPCSTPTDKMQVQTFPTTDKTTLPSPNSVNNSSPGSEELGTVPAKPVPETFQVYKTRFWILAVFSFICFIQVSAWTPRGRIGCMRVNP